MKILHAYCLNYNLGDYALGYGVKKALRELLPVELIAEVNLQGQVFNPYFIDIVNKNYDLLVIGGGGIIHGAHWPQGWFWLIEQELISTLKIPFMVFAAGYNYFKDEEGIPEVGVRHLQETAKLARLFSVRNDGSYERLKAQTGIDAKMIADAGFWIGRNETFARPQHLQQEYIVVQLANDKPEHRIGSGLQYDQFIKNLRQAIIALSKKYHIVMAPHVYADIAMSKEVAEGIANVSIWPFSEFAFDKVEHIFSYYEHATCVLGMRGHGQIIPLSFGVPTISLENHHKHRELMEHIGLGQFNVSVSDPMLSEKIINLVEIGISERASISSHMKTHLAELWDETKKIVQSVF